MPIRASPAAHGELWVPGQPCPMPPMVPRGPGGGSDGQQANLGLPEPSWGSGLVLAHQQHPKPPFQPLNQHHAAPPRAEPPPAPITGSVRQRLCGEDREEKCYTGDRGHATPDSLSPSQAPGPPGWQRPALGLEVFDSHQPAGPPQPWGQSQVPQSTQGGRALPQTPLSANTAPNIPPGLAHTKVGVICKVLRCWRSLRDPMQPSALSLGLLMPLSPEQLVTFRGPGSPQVINGPEDEPEGFLLIAGDAHHLHGSLELVELLGRLLLFLWL